MNIVSHTEGAENEPLPPDVTVVDMQAEIRSMATNALIKACLANGYQKSEIADLYELIQQGYLQAHLMCVEQGRPFWLIERMKNGKAAYPPENWTLPHYLAKYRAEVGE